MCGFVYVLDFLVSGDFFMSLWVVWQTHSDDQ